MSKENIHTVSLRELWDSLLDEEIIKRHESMNRQDAPDIEYQGIMMLLETAHLKAKGLCFNYKSLKSSNERVLSELQCKTDECNKLKLEIQRLERSTCDKCSSMDAELKYFKKKAFEAQNRMRSIANILKIGESIQDSQSPRKSSAFNLVSQMLLEESPKRKKRCLPKRDNDWKEVDIPEEEYLQNCDTLIHKNVTPLKTTKSSTPNKNANTEMITSPGDSPFLTTSDKTSKGVNLLPVSRPSPSRVRRALTSNFQKDSSDQPQVIPETEQNSMELNGSLAEYIKEASCELDRIWFNPGPNKLTEIGGGTSKETPKSKDVDEVVDETPERTPQKQKSAWKLKEVRGPAEQAGNRKVRQMRLSVSRRNKTKEVDISTLGHFDRGSPQRSNNSTQQPSTSTSRSPLSARNRSETSKENKKDSDQYDVYSEIFNPKATSTQVAELDTITRKPKKERCQNYVYKRDTVRKKSERAKLDGWDCEKCAEYYAACGETSPSKLKSRMNKCSRHRDNFKPTSNTPPGYWDPLFPDTEECRELGMYKSIHLQ